MRAVVLAMILLAGCGARSGLEIEPPADAGRPDAFAFDTFTCRWSYGERIEIEGPTGLRAHFRARVHPSRDAIALVYGDGREGPTDRMLAISLSRSPATLGRGVGPLPAGFAGIAATPDGWMFVHGGEPCDAATYPWDTFATSTGAGTLFDGRCAIDAIGNGTAISEIGSPVIIREIDPAAPFTPRDLTGPLDVGSGPIRVTRDTSGRLWVSTAIARRADGLDEIALLAISPEGAIARSESIGGSHGAPALAPDRLRGGAIVVLDMRERGVTVVRATLDAGAIATAPLGNIDLGAAPVLDAVTTESELLLAHDDGSYVSLPLSGAAPHPLPEPDDGAERGVIALVDGTSAGAVIYPRRDGPGWVLSARPLTCNR